MKRLARLLMIVVALSTMTCIASAQTTAPTETTRVRLPLRDRQRARYKTLRRLQPLRPYNVELDGRRRPRVLPRQDRPHRRQAAVPRRNQEQHLRQSQRTIVPGSLEVYPLKDYGAVEIGVHRFHHPGQPEEGVGEAKFITLWHYKDGSLEDLTSNQLRPRKRKTITEFPAYELH